MGKPKTQSCHKQTPDHWNNDEFGNDPRLITPPWPYQAEGTPHENKHRGGYERLNELNRVRPLRVRKAKAQAAPVTMRIFRSVARDQSRMVFISLTIRSL